MNNRLINTKVAGGGGGCTDIVDNYNPFGGGVALYQLNGNANDVSGNYNGTATNVTWGATGVFGTSGTFNGTSSRLQLNIKPTASLFTTSIWVNFNDVTKRTTIYGNINPEVVNVGYSLGMESGLLYLVTDNDNTGNWQMVKEYTQTISVNQWYNIVIVSNGSSTELYINNQVASYTFLVGSEVALNDNAANVEICFDGNERAINGLVDQVRIFNKVLSTSEIATLYAE